MVLSNRTGDPKGVPANAAHTGFINNDDWELEDGYWVRKKDHGDNSLFDTDNCKQILCDEPTAFGSEYCLEHTDDVVLSGD